MHILGGGGGESYILIGNQHFFPLEVDQIMFLHEQWLCAVYVCTYIRVHTYMLYMKVLVG